MRSFALCDALAERFRVTVFCGGRLPPDVRPPHDVDLVVLPGLGTAADGSLVSHDPARTAEETMRRRAETLVNALRDRRPDVLVVELFPFGRKKFAPELVPLLEEAQAAGDNRPLVVCSVRDILVTRPVDQDVHDDRACKLANRYFDAVLVHSDPLFARLEESFHPSSPLQVPVYHTGFVVRRDDESPSDATTTPRPLVVSAGGGLVGERLLSTAVEAYRLLRDTVAPPVDVITGPFVAPRAWRELTDAARELPGLRVRRWVPSLLAELRRAAGSVSQCGYNTALDLVRAAVPAVVVPYAEDSEDEQMRRARRLEALGAVRVLESTELSPSSLAAAIRALSDFEPRRVSLDLDGANATTRLLTGLCGRGS